MEIHEFTGPSLYHISRDNLGSILLYENSQGTHYQYSYSPWGVRTYLTGDTINFCLPGEEPLIAPFYRTYNAAILGQDIGSAMFTGAWQGAATGFVFGGITGYFSAKANGLNGWTGKSNVMATRHRPLMTGPDKLSPLPGDDLPTYSQADPADVLKQAKIQAGQGNSTVYVGVDKNEVIRYVGRTDRNPEIRFGEHFRDGRKSMIVKFETLTNTLDHNGSRVAEQVLINKYGLQRNEGQLINKINSISPKYWEKFGITGK